MLFAPLLVAPTPAPAQTTTTLLDIRSPATADPPSTSLLTVSDAGDLWIKGALVEYAYPGTITLDPSRQYWTLRDADGNVVWALEVYNPTTGVSAGDLHAACTFESYCDNVEQDDALFTARTASGEAVYTLSASRRTKAKGNNQTQTQAIDFHGPPASYTPPTPDAYDPAPDFLGELWEYYLENVTGVVPTPWAQGRIAINADPQTTTYADRDVTNTAWRRRLDRSITTLYDYGVRYGLRCTNAHDLWYDFWYGEPPVTPQWLWSTAGLSGLLDHDVQMTEDYWWDLTDRGGSYWSLVSFSPATLTAEEYATRIPVQYVLQDTVQDGGSDGQVTATSDLFLYTVHFHHPGPDPRANIPPRKAGDKSVNVGCCLTPRNIPVTWINRIELTLWDPADPSHRRVFKNTESECTRASFVGKAFISKMWDGKLWTTEDGKPDPQYPNDFYYTQASDFFMQATVYWNVSDPQKPWESTEPDVFTESRYAIVVEDYDWGPVSGDPYNFAWITPGGVSTPPQMPLLYGYIVANGGEALPETADWHLHVTFNRPTRNDSDTYPTGAPGYATVPGGQAWVVNFGSDFRGGKATTSCAFGGKTLTHVFHIRGYNASEQATIDYINANNTDTNDFSHWYARQIAEQESSLRHFKPATTQNPLPGPNELTDLVGQPTRGTSAPYGWGLFQLTQWREGGQEVVPSAQYLWNWKGNETKAIDILRMKRAEAVTWVNSQRALADGIPIPSHPYGDIIFLDNLPPLPSPEDACTISNYNPGRQLVSWDSTPGQERWVWRTDAPFTNYVVAVCSQP